MKRRLMLLAAAVLLTTGGALPLALGSSAASATTVGGLQARAAAIASQIEATNVKLQVLSEEYDQATLRTASLGGQVRSDRTALWSTSTTVRRDSVRLRSEAVDAYVNAGSAAGLSAVLTGNASSLPLQQTYLAAASGSLRTAMTSLKDSEHQLSVRQATLQKAERAAAESAHTIAVAKKSAEALVAQLEITQSHVKGQLASAVALQEAIQQRQISARDVAQQAAAKTVAQAAAQPPPTPAVTPTIASSSGGSGGAAVAAARTQQGVPYVWGGATPGQGFDCSGLVMWAWGQAGVNLPHSAQAQYDSIEHISMSQLQPGDLVFYASGGYIYHVIMYIGNGQAIQAETTGTVVQVTPVWPGAYGAGRP